MVGMLPICLFSPLNPATGIGKAGYPPISYDPMTQLPKGVNVKILRAGRGFSLVVTLSLMVLLAIVAVGMLSLASISLRSGQQGEAAATARANARLALTLAIGELQKHTGPDQRITMTADQIGESGSHSESSAANGRRHWTGVYNSWNAGSADRPDPEFRRWLVSGDDATTSDLNAVKTPSASATVELVGEGTVGSDASATVLAPLANTAGTGHLRGRHAWWVGDQGVKAAIVAPGSKFTADAAGTRQALLSAPRGAAEWAATGGMKPFAGLKPDTAGLDKVTGWKQAGFLADEPENPKPLFHDLAARGSGLLTNVRAGGFRKDLSFHLEKPASAAPRAPLYAVDGVNGINEAELWLYYNSWKELKTGVRQTYTTGGSVGTQTPYLQVPENLSALATDPGHIYKQPSFVSIQTILSLHARTVTNSSGQSVKRLALVIDPIAVLWNPLDVPVVVTPAYYSVKFWQLPYDLKLTRPSGTSTINLKNLVGAHHYLTLHVGKASTVALRPGEVVMISQGPNTAIKSYNPGLNFISGAPGWNFGGGVAIDIKTSSSFIETAGDETIRYEVIPNSEQSQGGATWFLTANDFFYKEDRTSMGETANLGGIMIDSKDGKPVERITAASRPEFFGRIKPGDTRPLSFAQLNGRKEPVLLYSYSVKTEKSSQLTGRFLARYNPKTPKTDFQTLTQDEIETLPYEVNIEPLDSWKNRNFDVSTNGGGFFGGGWTRDVGTGSIITHSIPREPVHSLAAFQHAFANGFSANPTGQFGNDPLLPQVMHPIGNSLAPSVIPHDRTSSSLGGPRPLADHSYLANQALWDDWFLSGIAPQTAASYTAKRAHKQVASDFLHGKQGLPNSRYRPELAGRTADDALGLLFSGNSPATDAARKVAARISVDGMFNVNSTSVEAWKVLLGGLRERPVTVRGATGNDMVQATENVPVVNLAGPENRIASDKNAGNILDAPQWNGRRELNEAEIDSLARAIVTEVRKRGPFLSLADFVNRRPGSDKEIARAGAIQSALDSKDVPINQTYNSGARSSGAAGPDRALAFPEAEQGAAAQGIPGVVKQADVLTPIAPFLSARSDTFIVRGYGDCIDANGRILARAWCEAEVVRNAAFVDPANAADAEIASINSVNRTFGRSYQIVSFRWLQPGEI